MDKRPLQKPTESTPKRKHASFSEGQATPTERYGRYLTLEASSNVKGGETRRPPLDKAEDRLNYLDDSDGRLVICHPEKQTVFFSEGGIADAPIVSSDQPFKTRGPYAVYNDSEHTFRLFNGKGEEVTSLTGIQKNGNDYQPLPATREIVDIASSDLPYLFNALSEAESFGGDEQWSHLA